MTRSLVGTAIGTTVVLLLVTFAIGPAAAHPMDPLTADEIVQAASILLDGGAAQPGAIFQAIDLREPAKSEVVGLAPGDGLPRRATVFFRQSKKSFRSVVNLTQGSFTPPVEIPRTDGQLGLTLQEIIDFAFVLEDPAFLRAMARRGIDTPEELARVLVTPLTAGAFGLPEEKRRIVKAQMYDTTGAGINLYARPIEGVQAIIDLDERRVIEVLDTGVVPVPPDTHDFDEATVAARFGLRPALKPIRITQPEGPNFSIDGGVVSWQKWRFHVRFERRAGTVISLVTYDGRSVLYQGSLAEVFVPYQDPGPHWFYRTYMDAGEFGFGALSSPLALGLDVPENAVLLDGLISAALPDPTVPVVPLPLPAVVGIFERVTGDPVWRHFEFLAGGAYEGRAEVELVVRMIAQVGNYDYMIDWIFTQHGALRVAVALTGIDIPKGVRSTRRGEPTAAADTEFGTLVAPRLVAPFHSHHFSFRLDVDVDGRGNSFVLGRLRTVNAEGPRRSVWILDEQVLARERDARLDEASDLWTVVNPGRKNALGYPTGYRLESHGHASPLLRKADFRRAGFIEHALWVTAFDPDERYAAGDTPNQHPGEPGLPRYVADNASLVDRDLVLWHTLSFHHVTTAEDFPVLPRHGGAFELKPHNFFDRNPALDLRRAPFEVAP
jgi:primary-amine oxidase